MTQSLEAAAHLFTVAQCGAPTSGTACSPGATWCKATHIKGTRHIKQLFSRRQLHICSQWAQLWTPTYWNTKHVYPGALHGAQATTQSKATEHQAAALLQAAAHLFTITQCGAPTSGIARSPWGYLVPSRTHQRHTAHQAAALPEGTAHLLHHSAHLWKLTLLGTDDLLALLDCKATHLEGALLKNPSNLHPDRRIGTKNMLVSSLFENFRNPNPHLQTPARRKLDKEMFGFEII
eukprot:gene13786-19695_t